MGRFLFLIVSLGFLINLSGCATTGGMLQSFGKGLNQPQPQPAYLQSQQNCQAQPAYYSLGNEPVYNIVCN